MCSSMKNDLAQTFAITFKTRYRKSISKVSSYLPVALVVEKFDKNMML